jgi:hypothetical protein
MLIRGVTLDRHLFYCVDASEACDIANEFKSDNPHNANQVNYVCSVGIDGNVNYVSDVSNEFVVYTDSILIGL